MKSRLSVLLLLTMVFTSFVSYATPLGVEIIPDGGPGVIGNEVSDPNAATEAFEQYDLNEKYTYTYANGCVVVCPKNISTNHGMVVTRNYQVKEADEVRGTSAYFMFTYTGLKKTATEFYIKATNAAGVMIDLKEVYCGYSAKYNSNKGTYKYKAVDSLCEYKIPKSAVKVEVLGVLESY